MVCDQDVSAGLPCRVCAGRPVIVIITKCADDLDILSTSAGDEQQLTSSNYWLNCCAAGLQTF
jgi:hypothetical protein